MVPDSLLPPVPNPYRQGVISVTLLVAYLALLAVVAAGLVLLDVWHPAALAFALLPLAFFAGLTLLVWLLGFLRAAHIRAFLRSDRPLLRFVYTPAEWQAVRVARWADERSDLSLRLGCASALFGGLGLMIGLIFAQRASVPLLPPIVGLLLGLGFAAALTGGALVAALWARAVSSREGVALGPHEVYSGAVYFRGDGQARYIERCTLGAPEADDLTRLEISAYAPRRGSRYQSWTLLIPARVQREVEEALPRLGRHVGPEPQTQDEQQDADDDSAS